MTRTRDENNPDIRQGDHIHGFEVLRTVDLKQINAFFYELLHPATGARHIHISNADAENTFGVALKTVPQDATGVAHILEHTVLCGSKRYPVRDPFFSMLKRSLSTFMNAFTASDWTMYPFATQNAKDFYNLMDVYLDAVFFANLNELNFKQEGHRLEFESAANGKQNGQLTYTGVVYNEMKGAMSSADQVLARSLLQALYPDTTYRFNSGGDPAVIPELTHAQLKSFHQQHYHPSNAYFYTYGNLPFADHLAFIADKVLQHYAVIDPQTEVPSQPRWNEPQRAATAYPLAKNEDPQKKYQVCVAWLTSDIQDTFQVLVLSILEQVLLGNPASPLRKALIDSQLGTSLSDAAGFDADNRDTMFVAGLKDVEESATGAIERIIFDTLSDLAESGIDPDLIESAIHQIEFRRKEVTNSPYPYGLKQLLMMIGSWIHGGDPLSKYRLDEHLRDIRTQMAAGGFFENMIRAHFLNNRHRVLFVLRPDQQLADEQKQRVRQELQNKLAQLSDADRVKIKADAETLRQLQQGEEDLSCLPTLRREDIPPDVDTVTETRIYPESGIFTYDQPTSGIAYISLAAGAGGLESDLMPLVPIFCYALPKIGTAESDYVQVVQRIDRYTGGMTLSAQARTYFDDSAACLPYVLFNAKALHRNLAPTLDIVRELMLTFDFSDLQRLKSLLLEYRAGLESMVVGSGHRLAISLAARHFSAARYLSEMWSGVDQLRMIKALTEDLSDKQLARQAERLRQVGKTLFAPGNLKIALIGEDDILERAAPAAESMIQSLPRDLSEPSANGFNEPRLQWSAPPPFEGWQTSTAVSFVARTFQTVRMAHADAPALAVISKMLRSLFLHREIREKGGAYGGFSVYNLEDGLFCYASYRDPHIAATLNVYRLADEFIRSGTFSGQDIDEAVLQVCSEIDRPDPPGPAARKAFNRRIIRLTDDARQAFKARLLAIGRREIEAAAEAHFTDRPDDSGIAVISGESQLAEANAKLERPLAIEQI